MRWPLLAIVQSLRLPDCWIAAGFVRDAVWDHLHGREPAPPGGNVDVIWFDKMNADPVQDRTVEDRLRRLVPEVRWSVKNQARMHVRNGASPYVSSLDAVRFWPETATAIAARREDPEGLEVAAPLGLDDLFGLVIRANGRFAAPGDRTVQERTERKGWLERWPLLTMIGKLHPSR